MHCNRNNCLSDMQDKRNYHKFDNIKFKRCFCNYYNPRILELINISNHIKKFGFVPDYLTDKQITNKINQAHNLIQTYFNELEQIEINKIKSKMKK